MMYFISEQDINDRRVIDCKCGTTYLIKPSDGYIVAEIQNLAHLKKNVMKIKQSNPDQD